MLIGIIAIITAIRLHLLKLYDLQHPGLQALRRVRAILLHV